MSIIFDHCCKDKLIKTKSKNCISEPCYLSQRGLRFAEGVYGMYEQEDKKRTMIDKEDLIRRIKKIGSEYLTSVELAVRRVELGCAAWGEYIKVIRKLRREDNDEKRRELLNRAMELCREHRFVIGNVGDAYIDLSKDD